MTYPERRIGVPYDALIKAHQWVDNFKWDKNNESDMNTREQLILSFLKGWGECKKEK